MKTCSMCLIAVLTISLLSVPSFGDTTVVTMSSLQNRDPLKEYNGLVLILALEKTKKEYGDYKIELTPVTMNTARCLAEIKKNSFTNLIDMTTFQNSLLDDSLEYARFPIDFGVTGYRIGFVSPDAKQKLDSVKTIEDLRKFTIGQGTGWADVEILRSNGFNVVEVSSYESLFKMVAVNRVDLFLRGINEIESQQKSHNDIPGLDYDRSVAIVYTLPRFYFSNYRNKALLDRITKGLLAAYRDGSLRQVWQEQYGSSLKFANIKQRKIFYLKTPNIDKIDFDYKKYFFDPKAE